MVVSKRKLFARPDSYSLFIRKFFKKNCECDIFITYNLPSPFLTNYFPE